MSNLFARACQTLSLIALLGSASAALAHEFKAGEIEISHPFARATISSAPNGAAYMVLTNKGLTADRLLSAFSPVASEVMLHMNIKSGSVMEMRHVAALDLPPGQKAELSPAGAYHLMLTGLKQPLKVGTVFPLTLVFEKAGEAQVMVAVERAGSMGPAVGQHH